MNVGIDLGYSAVKLVSDRRRKTFASVVGTPDLGRFSLGEQDGHIVLNAPEHVLVGEGAMTQSRFVNRREDRAWIESAEYYHLFLAALTELTTATVADLLVVTGLPVAFYNDKAALRERLVGVHKVTRVGRHAQTFKVGECRVIPQPFGTLLAAALDDRGHIADQDLATGSVGVIDVGGKTTNLSECETPGRDRAGDRKRFGRCLGCGPGSARLPGRPLPQPGDSAITRSWRPSSPARCVTTASRWT